MLLFLLNCYICCKVILCWKIVIGTNEAAEHDFTVTSAPALQKNLIFHSWDNKYHTFEFGDYVISVLKKDIERVVAWFITHIMILLFLCLCIWKIYLHIKYLYLAEEMISFLISNTWSLQQGRQRQLSAPKNPLHISPFPKQQFWDRF